MTTARELVAHTFDAATEAFNKGEITERELLAIGKAVNSTLAVIDPDNAEGYQINAEQLESVKP